MENLNELKQQLDQIRKEYSNKDGRIMEEQLLEKGKRVIGVVSEALKIEINTEVIITGGLSVEFYTEGNYATQDIDLVIKNESSNRLISDVLVSLGFEKRGNREWTLEDIGLYIEKVADTIFDGHHKETVSLETLEGYKIKFVNINDMIIDRIKGVANWEVNSYIDQIVDMITYNEEAIDYTYIEKSLTKGELTEWNKLKLVLDEDSFESKMLNLEKDLSKHKINYGFTMDELIIYFPLPYLYGYIYIGVNLIEKSGFLVYNEDTESFEEKELDSNILSHWKEFEVVRTLLKKGEWV